MQSNDLNLKRVNTYLLVLLTVPTNHAIYIIDPRGQTNIILLNNNKLPLNSHFYTHRIVCLSILTRESSFLCSALNGKSAHSFPLQNSEIIEKDGAESL